MDTEHKVMLEELAAIRATVLSNQKLLQLLVSALLPDMSWDELIQLLESDQKALLESIRSRLK